MNYYEILGVPETADETEIKKAYRGLAKEWHPDKHQGKDTYSSAEEKFKQLSEAYDTLSDTTKRSKYDMSRKGPGQFFATGDMSDFFRGGGFQFHTAPPTPQPAKGRSVHIQETISLVDALFGMEKEVSYTSVSPCDECNGQGGKEFTVCPSCQGAGIASFHQHGMYVRSTCPACIGTGKTIKEACPKCHGRILVAEDRKITVNFPSCLANGMTLRVAGAGGRGILGGPSGELLIQIRVQYPDLGKLSEEQRQSLRDLLA